MRDRQVGHVLLQSARARVCGSNGLSREVTCLFDAGTQPSFIRTAIANDLGLEGSKEHISIYAFGSQSSKTERTRRVRFSLETLDNRGGRQWMQALCLSRLCEPLEANASINRKWSHVRNLALADEFPRGKAVVDILIGLDYYYEFIHGPVRRRRREEPLAVQSSLGWILCGPTNDRERGTSRVLRVGFDDSADSMLKRFWQLESVGMHDAEETQEVSRTREQVDDLVSFDGCRYIVRLPWKSGATLPNNRHQALQRLELLEKCLGRDEQLARKVCSLTLAIISWRGCKASRRRLNGSGICHIIQ
uniref:DUF1758 domain-containing protein n=1 Tax=Trichuris muris TaxID=70415 RepID=A0A5S6R4J3_TRIMR